MMTIQEMTQKVKNHSDEYSFLNPDTLPCGDVIMIGLGGSHAYGTNVETSDIDLRGVAFRNMNDIFSGRDFEEVVREEVDTTIYSLEKMMKLLSECNPNCIEILGCRPQDYIYTTSWMELLMQNKLLFLSKNCIKTFGGYATAQLYRLQQKTITALPQVEYNEHIAKVIKGMSDHLENSWGLNGVEVHDLNGQLVVNMPCCVDVPLDAFYGYINEIANVLKEYHKNSKRNQKAIEHGKVNKHAMHLIRLYMMCIDILTKKEIITYRENEHDLLMDIRNGKYNEDGMMTKEFFDILREYKAKFEEAKGITTLPDKPDYEAIQKLLIHMNRSYCGL